MELQHLEGVESAHFTVSHNLEVNAKRVSEEDQKRFTKEAEDTRKKLMDGKPSNADLDAVVRKAYEAMFATTDALQKKLSTAGK